MHPILIEKFNGKAVEYTTQSGHPLYIISVYDKRGCMICYQPYKCIQQYCNDCTFEYCKTEFGYIHFTNQELKQLFELYDTYPDVDNYNLDILFNDETI